MQLPSDAKESLDLQARLPAARAGGREEVVGVWTVTDRNSPHCLRAWAEPPHLLGPKGAERFEGAHAACRDAHVAPIQGSGEGLPS